MQDNLKNDDGENQVVDNSSKGKDNLIQEMYNKIKDLENQISNIKQLEVDVNKKRENIIEASKQQIDKEKELVAKARIELENEDFVSSFDNKFGKLVNEESLNVINNANTTNQHKVVEKFVSIFKDENNFSMLPSFLARKVNDIINLNETERASYTNIESLKEVLDNFIELKTKLDLHKNIYSPDNQSIHQSVATKNWDKWLGNIYEKTNQLKQYI